MATWARETLMPELISPPEHRAQDLIYKAWETPGAGRRADLARRAIEIWPDCADAYNLLAAQAGELSDTIALYHEAMEAGARALGARAFKEAIGHFWMILETRPYMRALAGLAGAQWQAGHEDAALDGYRELLRLNPNDNQGIRYLLSARLVEVGRDDELKGLLAKYPDEGIAHWAYANALLAFRTDGDTARTRRLLAAALAVNRFVPPLLLGKKKLPRRLPDYIGFGDETEAVSYAADNLAGWRKSSGAIEWMARNV